MIFVETKVFTRQVTILLSDEDYRGFQEYLNEHPDAGTIIKGSGGLRKLRWFGDERGKSGGVRVIYNRDIQNEVIFLLFMYPKSERDDLSSQQLRILRRIVETKNEKRTL